jgi:hypothetical protein
LIALRADSLRSSAVIAAALAGPPFFPPFLPNFDRYALSSGDILAMQPPYTRTAYVIKNIGADMQEDTIKRLISNLTVLQGFIREANCKILALEEVLKDAAPIHYGRYRLLAQQYENDPKTFYRLEDVAGLEEALRRDHG